jgi:hypothetical protein
LAHPLLNWPAGDREVHSGWVGDGMKRYAHNYSRITAALLALCAACGSGRPAPTMGSKFVRMQNPAELDTENGLIATGLNDACLGLEVAVAPSGSTETTTTSTVDPSASTTTDPTASTTTDPAASTTTDPSATTTTDPTATTTLDPVLTDPTLTNPSSVDPNACMGANGMPPNLLAINGLKPNSLTDDHFKKWFATDPKTANTLMKYLVKCSLPAGLGMDFDYGGIHYVWPGLLGLAPHWAEGESIPEAEQQLVTACLAAHANRYGAHVAISLLGRDSNQTPLRTYADELSDFPVTEGCFFGNVFRKDGAFSANDRPTPVTADESSLRACALPDRTGSGASSMCAPIRYAGNCRDLCQPDPTNTYYVSCTVGGKSYLPVTTRIQRNVEYTCGDGICQVTESCGTGSSWNACSLDCGPCN